LKVIIAITLALVVRNLNAQSGAVNTGGYISNSSGSISYSIGQPFYNFFEKNQTTVTAGLQQPYVLLSIKTDGSVSVYPNPTLISQVTLKADVNQLTEYKYELYDLEGKPLTGEQLQKQETIIRLSGLASSVYILRVLHGSNQVKSFKIVVDNQ
jgi:hypothetical protein